MSEWEIQTQCDENLGFSPFPPPGRPPSYKWLCSLLVTWVHSALPLRPGSSLGESTRLRVSGIDRWSQQASGLGPQEVDNCESDAPGPSPSPHPASKGQRKRGLTHGANGELFLDQLLQLLLAQGVLVTFPARVLMENGHEEANSLIQGARHGWALGSELGVETLVSAEGPPHPPTFTFPKSSVPTRICGTIRSQPRAGGGGRGRPEGPGERGGQGANRTTAES